MRKPIIFLLLFLFACSSTEEVQTFKFNQIFLVDLDREYYIDTGKVKIYDSEDNLIGYQNDSKISVLETLELGKFGANKQDVRLKVFEIEISQDISNFLYLRINNNEYDSDDIEELIDSKCNILTNSLYTRTAEFKQLLSDVYEKYCS